MDELDKRLLGGLLLRDDAEADREQRNIYDMPEP